MNDSILRFGTRSLAPVALLAMIACGGATPPPSPSLPPAPPVSFVQPSASSTVAGDTLGPRPIPSPPPAFVPPGPKVLEGPGKSKVWLLERHGLPLVTIALVVPYGSSSEPLDKAGLAFATADMLDEGAGDRDALAFSQAINDLGARISSSADRDQSIVSLEVLATKLDQALPLLSDAIARPRNDKKDWTRVQSLWNNALKNRVHEPNDVARVVTTLEYYGEKHPYGHPPDGTITSAKKVQLADVAKWHKTIWRPDQATFVVTGDVTADQISSMLAKAFMTWQVPATPAPPIADPGPPQGGKGVRTFVVDRADAPQVVMSFAGPGPTARDPAYSRLTMLNIALGGSFTSRLNQNLREDHGWTYGVRSRFNSQRGVGMFVVRAAIRGDAITPALGETRKEIDKMAKEGVTDTEVDKLRAQLNGDALQSYGSLHSVAGSLASNAGLALAPDQDAKDLESQRSASAKDLSALASKYLDLSSAATVVLVGPKEMAIKALADNGFPKPTLVDAEGHAAR
jgi:zinc protease